MDLLNDQNVLTQALEQSTRFVKSDDLEPLEKCQGSGTRTLILREDGKIDMREVTEGMQDLNHLESGNLEISVNNFNNGTEDFKNIQEKTEFLPDSNWSTDPIDNFLISGNTKIECPNEEVKEDDCGDVEDEETIATFVTAAGQQLALYAVEDSDEIFAVAVYDESGAPPTNFQFLLKSDVERLIGEGAVKTVRKPSQIKKQLLDTNPLPILEDRKSDIQCNPIKPDTFLPDPSITSCITSDNCKIENDVKADNCILNSIESAEHNISKNEDLKLNEENDVNLSKDKDNLVPDVNLEEFKDINLSVTESTNSSLINTENVKEEYLIESLDPSFEEVESDTEVFEHSTVQYILFESEQSDSELTFDDIQASLKNFKSKKEEETSPVKNILSPAKKSRSPEKVSEFQLFDTSVSRPNNVIDTKPRSINPSLSNQNIKPKIYDIISKEEDISDEDLNFSTETIDMSHDSDGNSGRDSVPYQEPCIPPQVSASAAEELKEKMLLSSTPAPQKVKRPRKQQLTLVNRSDTEIIIQPAEIVTEEEVVVKRRGRRKKKSLPDPDYSPRRPYKKLKRTQRNPVEVIELDIDEENSGSSRTIEEITIDDKKGSSDKENDVIMVGDSEDEQELMLKCDICSRTFRQRRTLDSHVRVCTKSRKLSNKKRRLNEANGASKKKFPCKVCNKPFDVALALARHVRAEHPPRRRGRPSKIIEVSKPSTPEPRGRVEKNVQNANKEESRLRQKKPKRSPDRSWNVKKLHCNDCGKWFSSSAQLATHCLQHATKKSVSDQVARRCLICKKIIRSRLLYIQHMKIHKAKKNAKTSMQSPPKTPRVKRRLRQTTNKVTPLRKRRSTRKLRSSV